MRRTISYGDAIALLGGDSPAVTALDRAFGGALFVATAGGSELVVGLLGARGEAVRVGHQLIGGLQDRMRGYSRYDRTQRLLAAHAVIVVTAFFVALDEVVLPVDLGRARFTSDDQLRLARGGSGDSADLVDGLLRGTPPCPSPARPFEEVVEELAGWYRRYGAALRRFVEGLELWDELDETDRAQLTRSLGEDVPMRARVHYQILYRQLAVDAPEFAWWSGQTEHQATRAGVAALRRSLADLEDRLQLIAAGSSPGDRREALRRAYQAALHRPILAEQNAPAGLVMPTLDAGYIDPDFRVVPHVEGLSPASEGYWEQVPVRADLGRFLAGHVTARTATEAPLVVLGQPGAGKSVLTRILAARLPVEDFLPVRVQLREVPADADVQDQIEFAIRLATGDTVSWPEVARSAGDALPVVLLDGFDELLQATGVSQTDYLDKVARFQQREADQGRPVAVLVTSRVAVADRARIPAGATLLRLEPFRPEQVGEWLGVWNDTNAQAFTYREIMPLSPDTVSRFPDLARQPVLLMMLALYDADANDLQRQVDELHEVDLYERLLRTFADRQIRKRHAGIPDSQIKGLVEAELLRLAVASFAMFNRARLWATSGELDRDLIALTGDQAPTSAGLRAPLGHGDQVIGAFFFIHRAQAMRDGVQLATYEFLHATFGEYLLARLVHRVIRDLAVQEQAFTGAALGASQCQDGLLYALLSFAPLSNLGPVLAFLRGLAVRLPVDEAATRQLPITLFHRIDRRTDHRFPEYRPTDRSVPARYARYGLNLVLLAILYNGEVTADALLPGGNDPIGAWRQHACLWQSSLADEEWYALLHAVRVRRQWLGERRDLRLALSEVGFRQPDPVDLSWTHSHDSVRGMLARVLGWQAAMTCDPYTDLAAHTLEPILETVERAADVYHNVGPASRTMVNALLRLWVGGEGDALVADVMPLYRAILGPLTSPLINLEADARSPVLTLLLHRLVADAPNLGPTDLIEVLEVLAWDERLTERQRTLVVEAVLAHLGRHRLSAEAPEAERLTNLVLGACSATRPAVYLRWFVGIHEVGWRLESSNLISNFAWDDVDDARLLARARRVLTVDYQMDLTVGRNRPSTGDPQSVPSQTAGGGGIADASNPTG